MSFVQIKKKLRIFISHQYPVRFESDTTGMDDEQVQYWEMRVEGRLLDDVSSILTEKKKYVMEYSFSQIPINMIKEKRNENFLRSSEV